MAGAGDRAPLRRAVWPIALNLGALVLGALLLAACAAAKPGEPALPAGFVELGLPPVDVNAAVYFNSGGPVSFPLSIFGDTSGDDDGIQVSTVEGLINDPEGQVAIRAEFIDEANASRAAGVALRVASGSEDAWADRDGNFIAVGRARDEWSAVLRPAWITGERESIEERHPLIWDSLRLLPEEPPAPPVAAGFVRNVADLLDQILEDSNVSFPGLTDALGLIRVESVGFAGYANDVTDIPTSPTLAALRELDAGLLAVSEAGYPGTVVDFLYDRFVERAELTTEELDGETVQYRAIDGDLHLMVKNYGSSFFFAFSSTKGGVEELIRSVIKSQESR